MTNERIQPITWLANETSQTTNYEQLCRQEAAAQRLSTDFNVLPTIGCEVEVKWSALFPEIAEEYFGLTDELGRYAVQYSELSAERQNSLDERCMLLDKVFKPRYEATVKAGIPMGNDAYWEFAHSPSYAWQIQAEEIRLLMEDGLIPVGTQHSLHITLGGVNTEGGGPNMVLSGLELVCGTPERIRLATQVSKLGTSSAWNRRGNDGQRHRSANYLEMGQTHATELRTLAATTPEATGQTIRTAQLLGSILLAYRQCDQSSPSVIFEIAQLWPEFKGALKDLWVANDLPAESWGPPHQKPAKWLVWAECISRRGTAGRIENTTAQAIEQITNRAEYLLKRL